MNAKKCLHGLLLALLTCVTTFDTASACGFFDWNCLETHHELKLRFKIEDVDELRRLVDTTARNIEDVSQVIGGETRQTIEKAKDELKEYTKFLDDLIEGRIADVDERIEAKLLWIQQYTEQVNAHVQEIIRVTSQEVQTVIGVSSQEAQQIINTGGHVMQDTIRITNEELRFSMLTASEEVKEIVAQVSVETQKAIRTATDEVNKIVDNTIAGIERVMHTAEGSSLRILEGTLYIVERGADLTLAIGSAAAGFIFLFIAAYGWGKGVLQHKMPEAGLTRTFVMSLMVVTFLAALLPFGFLSKNARAYALLPMSSAKVYAKFGERLPAEPQINTIPLTLVSANVLRIVIEREGTRGQVTAERGGGWV